MSTQCSLAFLLFLLAARGGEKKHHPCEMNFFCTYTSAGAPATVRKQLHGESADWVKDSAQHYVELARAYLEQHIGGS